MTIVLPRPTHQCPPAVPCSCAAAPELGVLVDHRRVAPGPRTRLPRPPHALRRHADLIIVGRLVTMDPARPEAEAIAVSDGRIVAVGDLAEVEGVRGPGTEVLELGDQVAYPGFVEPHMHLWASAMQDGWVDCSPLRLNGFDAIVSGLRDAGPTKQGWTLGAGFDPSLLPGEPALTRDILDAAIPDRPALVLNASLHFAYLNSRALEAAGLHEDEPDPAGGTFGRTAGRLDGSLGELPAMARGLGVVPQMSHEELLDAIVAATQRAARRGVTKVHEALTGAILGAAEIDLVHSLSDRLATRVSYAISGAAHERLLATGIEAGAGDDMVRAVSWKLVSDGSNQGRSGFQREDYLGSAHRGHANYTVDELAAHVRLAHDRGWQVMLHANGDAAIGLVLDAYEAGLRGASGLRHRDRIEHCSVPEEADLERMARLGISPSFLMNHLYYWGRAFAENIFGPEKAGRLGPVASAVRHGLRPSFHSDYTVTAIDPLRSVQTAVTRVVRDGDHVLNGHERVPAQQAMRAVTIDAAWQIHADDVLGSLEVGKYADLVVLDADPCLLDPEAIADIGIARTMLQGQVTFSA